MPVERVETSVEMVRRLLNAQFPDWAELPITRLASSGTDNDMYRIGDELVARLPRVDWAVEAFVKEQRWLPWLAPRLSITIPTTVALGVADERYPWPWAIYKWIDGVNPEVGAIAEPDALAVEIGALIAALHALDAVEAPPPGDHNFWRGCPLSERDEYTVEAIRQLGDTIDGDVALAAWQDDLAAPQWDGPPTWIHGDLSPGNLLCVDGSLGAVIDFDCLAAGDPAADLVVAWNLLPAASRNTFRAAIGVDDATWRRGRGWALSIALIQLPYYAETIPALAANSRHVIGEVLADHLTT